MGRRRQVGSRLPLVSLRVRQTYAIFSEARTDLGSTLNDSPSRWSGPVPHPYSRKIVMTFRSVLLASTALALLLASAAPAASQDRSTTTSDTGTPEEQIDRVFAALDRGVPGAAVAVVKDGELVFSNGYGLANLEYGEQVTAESVFYVASLSKQFTGFAIAMLVADGTLSLDEPVHRYIPELPDYGSPLRIGHLVHHTSGLRNVFALFQLGRGGGASDLIRQEDVLEIIKAQGETNFEPGTEFLYSNAGYILLAAVIERVSGRTFPQFMEDEVFGPLAMTSTFILDDHERIIPNRVDSYKRTRDGELKKVVAPLTVQGSSGVYSSAEDLARWLANLQDPRVGGARVVALMHETGTLDSGEPLNYGSGLDFGEHRGLSLVGHGGDYIGYRAYAGRIPEHDLGVVVLSTGPDAPDPFQTFLEVVEILLGHHLGDYRAIAADSPGLFWVAGEYVSDAALPVYLAFAGDTLYGRVGGGPLRPLTAIGDSAFSGLTPWGASFRISSSSDPEVLTLSL
jgi:CubicO group peptidase (beta-lactamase class C family)